MTTWQIHVVRRAQNTRAFTLIELLIVIGIIALLLGILAPSLAEARRSARYTIDVANLRQHSSGAAAWAAENKGRMPNTRASTASGLHRGGGPRYLPDIGYAWEEMNESNGWALKGGSDHSNFWKWYQPVFGAYITDAEGVDLIANEMFLSPGAGELIEQQRLIKKEALNNPDLFDRPEFKVSPPKGSGGFAGATSEFAHPDLGGVRDSNYRLKYLTGSYRYTLTALYGDFIRPGFDGPIPGANFFGALDIRVAQVYGGRIPFLNAPSYSLWRQFVQQEDFAFPSKKVMFWEIYAVNSASRGFYNHPGAKVAVTMIDGSARIANPSKECPSYEEGVDAFRQGDNWGINVRFALEWEWEGPASDSPYAKGFATKNKPNPAWFALTYAGSRGRDF